MAEILGVPSRPLRSLPACSSFRLRIRPSVAVRFSLVGEEVGELALELALELASEPATEFNEALVPALVRILVVRGDPLMGTRVMLLCPLWPKAPFSAVPEGFFV